MLAPLLESRLSKASELVPYKDNCPSEELAARGVFHYDNVLYSKEEIIHKFENRRGIYIWTLKLEFDSNVDSNTNLSSTSSVSHSSITHSVTVTNSSVTHSVTVTKSSSVSNSTSGSSITHSVTVSKSVSESISKSEYSAITNSILPVKSYVGSAKNLSLRINNGYLRISALNKSVEHGSVIAKALLKYGYDAFSLTIIDMGPSPAAETISVNSDHIILEQFMLDYFTLKYNARRLAPLHFYFFIVKK